MKIVVLAGGLSTERDVSFKTGDMVAKALRENGHPFLFIFLPHGNAPGRHHFFFYSPFSRTGKDS